jgi:hypothetical protein
MTDEIVNRVCFDRKFWPKQQSAAKIEIKFEDLWENYSDEMSVEVAKALIDDPPRFHVILEEQGAQMRCSLWNVGGDTLIIHRDLIKFIDGIVDRAFDQVDGMKLGYLAIEMLQNKLIEAKMTLDQSNAVKNQRRVK